MSTEKIKLPDFVIANLYKDNLVLGNDLIAAAQRKIPSEKSTTDHSDTGAIAQAPTTMLPSNQAPVETKQVPPKPVAPKPVAPKPVATMAETSKPNQPAISHPEPPKQWFLGNNGKQIGILIKDPQVAFISDAQLQFLSNILNACKLNLGDVALINMAHHPLPFVELKKRLQPKFMILFDLSTQDIQLPFTIPTYQVQAYDQCSFLLASSLTSMQDNSQEAKLEKSKLWISLKNMFQL